MFTFMNIYHIFKELERRVQDEQREYNEYLKKVFEGCAEDYDYIHPEAKRYVDVSYLRGLNILVPNNIAINTLKLKLTGSSME